LETDFEIQYFFNTFNTAWEPCMQQILCVIRAPLPAMSSGRHYSIAENDMKIF